MKFCFTILMLVLAVAGCTTRSAARLKEQNAFLAGQNAALRQQQAQFPSVTVAGAVEKSPVPWVAGLTLTQAIATAKYLGQDEPKDIILTRQGESARLDPNVLFNGTVVPLEPGDIVEIR
jgi:hypothetical protein